jgi:Fur family transcriptional regulator, zinc uptake regulator
MHRHASSCCDHAAHQNARGPAALAEAEETCRIKGVRLTRIRKLVLQTLYATHVPLGAYDIAARIALQKGAEPSAKPLPPITIYRALDFLLDNGLAHRLASRNAFIACPHGHKPHDMVAFLICETCGGVDEISTPDLSQALAHVIAHEHFRLQAHSIEMSGYCKHCQTL